MWAFVYEILTNSTHLVVGLEKMQNNEAVDASAEEASWLKWISEIERKQECLLYLRLEEDIKTERFRAKSASLSKRSKRRQRPT